MIIINLNLVQSLMHIDFYYMVPTLNKIEVNFLNIQSKGAQY